MSIIIQIDRQPGLTRMPLTSNINKSTNTLTISISGNFDFSTHPAFRSAYDNTDSSLNVIVDLKQTEYMDSAALGMLLLLDEHFPNQTVKIIGCSDFIKQVLEIANFQKKFDIS